MAATKGTVRSNRGSAWRTRGDWTLRVLSALPLGYTVASLWAAALARLLPVDRAEAAIWATLAAFVICAAAAIWAFAARSGWRATWTLALLGALPALVAWTSIAAGGRL